MKLSSKIQEWQDARIIDSVTADKLIHYETQHSKPLILWALGGLGCFSIVVGLVSVIAANWLLIPDWLKLGVDLLVCPAIATLLYRTIYSK
mgnify:CR=1 FL=1